MKTENKVLMYATSFAVVAGGVMMLSISVSVLGIRNVQKAQAFNLIADGYRAILLAETYDAKAAAQSIKAVMSEVI